MAITKVWVEEGCTVCNLCEDTAPEVFNVTDETCEVREGVDFNAHEEEIIQAAEECPVEIIKYE
ncbi:MAG: ferredoxin [Candidatus Krumholzibacteriia bacterium]|nr:ferredoxin [bacterium]MCB9513970.1 ferredoxin [Candidatus Latescibacterota bacterium]MCB9517029.1 ferredoxin [Candidatus Latescibacterota bacterium]